MMDMKNGYMKTALMIFSLLLAGCGGNAAEAPAAPAEEETSLITEAAEQADTYTSAETTPAVTEAVPSETESAAVTEEPQPEETTMAEEAANYNSIYAPVLGECFDLIRNGDIEKEYAYISTGLIERVMYPGEDDLMSCVGYIMEDISGDGIPELMIGENTSYEGSDPKSTVYAVYTVKDGSPLIVIEGWVRSSYGYMGDGRFFYLGSGGAANTYTGKCRLSEDGTRTVWDDIYFTDIEDEEIIYYHNDTGSFEAEESERVEMSAEEFGALMDDSGVTAPEWGSIIGFMGDTASESGIDLGEIYGEELKKVWGTWRSPGSEETLFIEKNTFTLSDSEKNISGTVEAVGNGSFTLIATEGELGGNASLKLSDSSADKAELTAAGESVQFIYGCEFEPVSVTELSSANGYDGVPLSAPVSLELKTTGKITDLSLLKLEYKDISDDGVPSYNIRVLMNMPLVEEGVRFNPVIEFTGSIPGYGISYKDSYGRKHYFDISQSGYDGSVEFTPFAP